MFCFYFTKTFCGLFTRWIHGSRKGSIRFHQLLFYVKHHQKLKQAFFFTWAFLLYNCARLFDDTVLHLFTGRRHCPVSSGNRRSGTRPSAAARCSGASGRQRVENSAPAPSGRDSVSWPTAPRLTQSTLQMSSRWKGESWGGGGYLSLGGPQHVLLLLKDGVHALKELGALLGDPAKTRGNRLTIHL